MTPNGRRKAEIMKEVIAQTMSEIGVSVEDEFSIEEMPLIQEDGDSDETMSTDSVWEVQEEVDKPEESQEEIQEGVKVEENITEKMSLNLTMF